MDSFVAAIALITQQLQLHLKSAALIVGVLFIVHVINISLSYRLLYLGIVPRKFSGLIGIVCAPLLHADFNHLFFNCIPLFVLSLFMLVYGTQIFLLSMSIILVLSGLLTWMFGRKAIHIGASGVITGMWGYLIVDAYLQQSIMSILLALVCIYYFAGIFFGIIPTKKGVSWEGHAFGLVAGIVTNVIINQLFVN